MLRVRNPKTQNLRKRRKQSSLRNQSSKRIRANRLIYNLSNSKRKRKQLAKTLTLYAKKTKNCSTAWNISLEP